jgi:hypothetical protein
MKICQTVLFDPQKLERASKPVQQNIVQNRIHNRVRRSRSPRNSATESNQHGAKLFEQQNFGGQESHSSDTALARKYLGGMSQKCNEEIDSRTPVSSSTGSSSERKEEEEEEEEEEE